MCAYKGKQIAELCLSIAHAEHEVEELLAKVNCRSWAVAAEEARAALVRRRDLRAVEVLDRISGKPEAGPGVIDYIRTVAAVRERGEG